MQSPPFPRYLVPPRSKYSPQHHVLKHNTVGKGCKLKGFMAAKYIFPEPTYRDRQRIDKHCFALTQHYESTQEIL